MRPALALPCKQGVPPYPGPPNPRKNKTTFGDSVPQIAKRQRTYQDFRVKQPGWRFLDTKHFDASFVRVDEAEIIPPCSTWCLAVSVCFRPKSIPAMFVGESTN